MYLRSLECSRISRLVLPDTQVPVALERELRLGDLEIVQYFWSFVGGLQRRVFSADFLQAGKGRQRKE